jgi:hypothetical protein
MATLREIVFERAGGACEYCEWPQALTVLPHELDHIVAQQHHGPTDGTNLCVACALCNAHKGPNLSGIDPKTGQLTRLYHPRHDQWSEHFQWRGATLTGLSAIGRATIDVLKINAPDRVLTRQLAMEAGLFPVAH